MSGAVRQGQILQDVSAVDCGGTLCGACPTCGDDIENGDEIGVDCGGSCAAECGCDQGPFPGCRLALSSSISTSSPKDGLKWAWKKGEATTLADLADPTSTADYQVCVYSNGALLGEAEIAGRSTCGDPATPCWKLKPEKGYSFKDKAAAQGGAAQVKVAAGADGKAGAKVALQGNAASSAMLPLAAPVVVQLRNLETDVCLESSFALDDFKTNDPAKGTFGAKSSLETLP